MKAIHQSVDGYFLVDDNCRIHQVNDAACQMLGYSKDELLALSISEIDLLYPPQRIRHFFHNTHIQDTVTHESLFLKSDGTTLPIEFTNNYIKSNGQILSCTVVRDISLRKQAEEALRNKEQKLRAILNHHFQFTGLMNPSGEILMVNEATTATIGYTESQIIGLKLWETPWWRHSKSLQKKMEQAVSHAAQGEFIRFEAEFMNINNEIRYTDFSLTPLRLNDSAKIDYIIPEGRDITEIKRTEQKLSQALVEVKDLKDRLQDENNYLQEELKVEHNFNDIIGQSAAYQQMVRQIEQVATTDATVLILGESGTGKELIARAVHELSHRKERPLVKVNCAALPEYLIESELFGHEKGAFTGASTSKIGRCELAHKGTLFLDEIGELPFNVQAKLLRFLQEGEFERLGSTHTIKVDVRIIAATNRHLEQLVDGKSFREDLYYRLNVFPINSPSLRQRTEDIPLLVRHFVEKYNSRTGKLITKIPRKVMTALTSYSWPGNIRELENIIERALIISTDNKLEIGPWLEKQGPKPEKKEHLTLAENEKRHITQVLKETNWRVSGQHGAAVRLDINAQTLVSRMKKLGIQRPN